MFKFGVFKFFGVFKKQDISVLFLGAFKFGVFKFGVFKKQDITDTSESEQVK